MMEDDSYKKHEIAGYLEVMMQDCSLEQAIQRAIDTYACSHEEVIEALKTLSEDWKEL